MKTQKTTPWLDMVTVKLFADSGKYRDDLFVSVNGRRFGIKRGEEVSVPRPIADVIAESEAQDKRTAALIERLGGTNV